MSPSSILSRVRQWWLLDCQRVRRTLGITISDRALVNAYYGRYPARYSQHAAEWAARQASRARPMLTCALRWEGLGTGSVRAVCWHCETEMPDPHARRLCTIPAPDIRAVIRKEEEAMARMLDRARGLLAADSASDITGKRLAYLHQTHGIDSSVAESVLGPIPESVHQAYLAEYQVHCATGVKGKKTAVLTAK